MSAPTEASRRRATLLPQHLDVDPFACAKCHGPLRIIACVTQASMVYPIPTLLRSCTAHEAHACARSPRSS